MRRFQRAFLGWGPGGFHGFWRFAVVAWRVLRERISDTFRLSGPVHLMDRKTAWKCVKRMPRPAQQTQCRFATIAPPAAR